MAITIKKFTTMLGAAGVLAGSLVVSAPAAEARPVSHQVYGHTLTECRTNLNRLIRDAKSEGTYVTHTLCRRMGSNIPSMYYIGSVTRNHR